MAGATVRERVDALAARVAAADEDADLKRPDGASGGQDDDPGIGRLRHRLRLIACCAVLLMLAIVTRSGTILADTKIDMAVNPLDFLGRALSLWDLEQFGQLQNQAVGYLFPFGPFYAFGHLADIPPWIVQRLWIALLMCIAFLGAHRLAERLHIGGPLGRLLAGMAYALAPNGLATLGQISSEYLPYAMMPWIVLPLITAVNGGSPIKSAARSGIAVACCSGINAATTVAVLLVPVLYLLTRPRGSQRIRLLAWWSAAVAFASTWWLVPLLLTGTYGYSWLTYTEKAITTTGPTSLVNILRGTHRWVNYLIVDGQIWYPVGHQLSLATIPILLTGLVAALGLAGLLRPGLPERTFLLVSLLAGIVIISAGHITSLDGPLTAPMRELIDGPLAPLRNLHKFDSAVRLPLILGMAHLLAALPKPRIKLAAVVLSVAAVTGVGLVPLNNGLSGPGEFEDVPKYWRDASSWLNARSGEQAVLAVPGSAFGEYLWGRPMDDIMQPLLDARWGVRQLVPAGSSGYTRALDAIDQAVTSGRMSPGLAEYLGRMGVRYVLVRNDLSRQALREGWPARLHQTLEAAPGLSRVAAFGPPTGLPAGDAVASFDQVYPALEVYEIEAADDAVSLQPAKDAIRVYGSPDALLTMADNQVLGGRPVLLNNDAPDLPGTPVVADSLRKLKRNFGELHETTPTRGKNHRGHFDILEPDWRRYATTAGVQGIKSITASSSAANAGGIPQAHDIGRLPYAAVDGDARTNWQTGGWEGPLDQWLKITFKSKIEPGRVTAAFVQEPHLLGPPPAEIAVETEAGTVAQPVQPISGPQQLRVPKGRTGWLRIRILRLTDPAGRSFLGRVGVAELAVQGVEADRHLRLPAVPPGADGAPQQASVVLSRSPGAAADCMRGSERWVCSPALERHDEDGAAFHRRFDSPSAVRTPITGTATLVDPTLIRQYVDGRNTTKVRASSASSNHPVVQARSAFDDDSTTTWIAGTGDVSPWVSVSWKRPVQVDRLAVARPWGARGPVRVQVTGAGGESREGLLDQNGRLRFRAMRTNWLRITFTETAQITLQISDVEIPGVSHLPAPGPAQLNLPCGYGPTLKLNGARVRTKVTGTYADLLTGRPLKFQTCADAPLVAGTNDLDLWEFSSYRVESAVLDAADGLGTRTETAPVSVQEWSQTSRRVEVDAADESFLVVNENYNAGWQAEVDGSRLRAVRIDGWRQAWVVPAGTTGVVELRFTPDGAHRAAVLTGLNMLAALFFVAWWPASRRQGRRRGIAAVAQAMTGSLRRMLAPGLRPVALARRPIAAASVAVSVAVSAAVSTGAAAGVLAGAIGFWTAGWIGLAVAGGTALLTALLGTRLTALRHRGPRPLRLLGLLFSSRLVALLMVGAAGSWALGGLVREVGNPAAPTDLLGDVVPQLLGLIIIGRIAAELLSVPRAPVGPAAPTPVRLRQSVAVPVASGSGSGVNGKSKTAHDEQSEHDERSEHDEHAAQPEAEPVRGEDLRWRPPSATTGSGGG